MTEAPLDTAWIIHIGGKDNQEDCLLVDGEIVQEDELETAAERTVSRLPALFAVCDGMGGLRRGEWASRFVCSRLAEEAAVPESGDGITARLGEIQEEMLAAGSGESGTTVALLAVLGDRALVVNAGDSRVYRLDGGGAEVLSHDHSLVQSLVDHGHIGPGDVPGHPYRHVVEFGLGPPFERTWRKSGEHCHVREVPARPGDTFLLCTDGVNDTLTDEEIGRRLSPPDADALTALARHLAERARDNFTAVLVRLPGGPG